MIRFAHPHRFRIWLAGFAALCVLLLWPSLAAAHADELELAPGPTAPITATQTFSVFLPFVSHQRPPSSFTLITQALKRGEITEETALIYQVFATFGDERLPARLRGDNSGVIDSDAVSEATQRFADLSPATRETLVPFLIPPVYAGSWYDLRMNGVAATQAGIAPTEYITDRCKELAQGLLVPLESAHFVVWYPPFDTSFAERALQISINLETRIHPILTDLLREPLSDAGLGCNPGDGRLDVYMPYDPIPGKENVLALVSTYPGKGCRAAPTYMVVLRQGPSEVGTIAHEFMHMIQFGYNPTVECFHSWWIEATANWAIEGWFAHNVKAAGDI